MADLHTLRDLQRRLGDATGSDTDLDTAIADALEPGRYRQALIPAVTGSIDDAVDLIDRMLPGCGYMLAKGKERASEPAYGAVIYASMSTRSGELGIGEHDANQAIACCIALISALIARRERANA